MEMVNNCLLTAYWCVGIRSPLQKEGGRTERLLCLLSPPAAWLLPLSVQLERERLRGGGIKARQGGRRGRRRVVEGEENVQK